MPLRVQSKYSTNVVIDGELVPIKINRLLPEEAIDFNRMFARFGRQSAGAATPPADETYDARKVREDQEAQDEREAKRFVFDAISKFVTVEPGHIYRDDETEPITKGADFVKLFGARDEVLSECLLLIFMENKLNAEQKASWRLKLAPFVPTPAAVAEKMMDMAKVGPEDRVVDLGCGNGVLCVAAAKRGATVTGYDIDSDRIGEAVDAATKEGVLDRCTFVQKDALTADVSQASLVTLYLLAGANAKLRPILLRQLPAGARVVSHAFVMGGDWMPEETEFVPLGEGEKLVHGGQRNVYLYSVDRYRKSHEASATRVLSLVNG